MILRHLAIVCCVGILTGCSDKNVASGGCEDNEDCSSGQVCVGGDCRSVCITDDHCPSGQICVADSCEEGTRENQPVITSIDGNGTANATTTHPNGILTDHRIRTEITVTGEHLQGAWVALVPGVGSEIELSVDSSSATELVALLPNGLTEGEYVLRIENSAGFDQATTWVLKGEDGDPGPTGPSPSEADIQAAVSAMTNLDVPSLAGRDAAGYQTTAQWGALYEAEDTIMGMASVVGEPLAAGDVANASGGQGLRGRTSDGTGIIAGFSSIDLGEPIAVSPVNVEFRLMVANNSDTTTIGTVGCHATRHDAATYDSVRDIKPNQFPASGGLGWQTFSLRCDFQPGDTAQSIAIDYTVDTITELGVDYVRIAPDPSTCPPGWWSIAGGRLCMDSVLHGPALMYPAVATCDAMEARVCTYMDMRQACGAGFNPYAGSSADTNFGWLGDHATVPSGNTDDEYLTWNHTACSTNGNGDGPPDHFDGATRHFRCCW